MFNVRTEQARGNSGKLEKYIFEIPLSIYFSLLSIMYNFVIIVIF